MDRDGGTGKQSDERAGSASLWPALIAFGLAASEVGVLFGFVPLAVGGIVLGLPTQPPPDAAGAANTVDRVANSEVGAAATYEHDATEIRVGTRQLWLRNVGSTASSQAIDTVIFISVAFVLFQGMGLGDALALMVGQYVFKLGVAVVDTPFVYGVVSVAGSRTAPGADAVAGD